LSGTEEVLAVIQKSVEHAPTFILPRVRGGGKMI
jgi:hypothetical protein